MTALMKTREAALAVLVCVFALAAAFPAAGQQQKKYGKLSLGEYAPKTTEEAAIVDVLLRYEGAFNAHDLAKFVSLFSRDGVYRPCGASPRPIASKDCQEVLTRNFTSYKFETYYDPQITVTGSEATVKALLETGSYLGDYTFEMKKAGKRWVVVRNDYSNVRYKGSSD